jgi:hypothetical protein
MEPLVIPKKPAEPLELPINCYRWDSEPGPKACCLLSHDGRALSVKLVAHEWPLAARTWEDGGPVCLDSCMELFIRPDFDARYVNFEINPLGAMVIEFGEGRHGRENIVARVKPLIRPALRVDPCEGVWSAAYCVPFDALKALYGRDPGARFHANAYKCGGIGGSVADGGAGGGVGATIGGPFGSWNPIMTELPDFHRPEYFGGLALAE